MPDPSGGCASRKLKVVLDRASHRVDLQAKELHEVLRDVKVGAALVKVDEELTLGIFRQAVYVFAAVANFANTMFTEA